MKRPLAVASMAVLIGAGAQLQGQVTADSLITNRAMAGVRLCSALASVGDHFRAARDTTLTGEDGETRWPAKVVRFGAGLSLLAEASWVDSAHVWRLSTDTPAFRTASGVHVGSAIADILTTGSKVSVEFPEGVVFFTLSPEHIAFEIDSASAARFAAHFRHGTDPLTVLARSARVTRFTITRDCRRPVQPPN